MNENESKATALLTERIQRVKDAIALREPDKLPVAPMFSSVIQRQNWKT